MSDNQDHATKKQKPIWNVIGYPYTPEKMAAMYRELTGKETSPEGMAKFKVTWDMLNAKVEAAKANESP